MLTWINGVVVIHDDVKYEHALVNGVSLCLINMFWFCVKIGCCFCNNSNCVSHEHSLFFVFVYNDDDSDDMVIHGMWICRVNGFVMSMFISDGGGGFALLRIVINNNVDNIYIYTYNSSTNIEHYCPLIVIYIIYIYNYINKNGNVCYICIINLYNIH